MSPKDRMAAMMAGMPYQQLSQEGANAHFGDGPTNSFNMRPPAGMMPQANPAFNLQPPPGFDQQVNPAFNLQPPSEAERQQRLRQMMGGTMR